MPPEPKPDKPNKPRKRVRRITRRARRDVRAAFRPQFNLLDRQESEAERETEQYRGQVSDLYTGLDQRIGELGPQYQGQVAGITQGLQGSLDQLASSLPGGLPSGEAGAANQMFGQIGAGGLSTLAGQAARGVGSNTSALRQVAIDSTNYQASVMQDLADFRSSLESQRTDLTGSMAPLVLSRIDELRDRAKQLRLARQEFELRKMATEQGLGLDRQRLGMERQQSNALMQFTEAQLEDALRARRRRRRDDGYPTRER